MNTTSAATKYSPESCSRHARDRERDVGPDPPFKEGRKREVYDPTAADHCCQERERDPERPAIRKRPPGPERQVEPEQHSYNHRRRHQGPELSRVVVFVVVVVMMIRSESVPTHQIRLKLTVHCSVAPKSRSNRSE